VTIAGAQNPEIQGGNAMTIHYNITGVGRKRLVHAISELMGEAPKYLRTPTYAYQVGEYHIDKTGTVTGPYDRELESDLRAQGFEPSDIAPETDADEAPTIIVEAEAPTATDEAT